MHVMDDDTSYHIILGCPCLKAHKAMASTYHQCIKVVWKGRLVTIKATSMPYDRAELHYAKVALYQEFKPKRQSKILPFNATILESEEEGDKEVLEPKRPSKIRRTAKLDGKVVYEF